MLEKQSNFKAWLYLAPATILLAIFTFYPLFNAFFLSILEGYDIVYYPVTGTTETVADGLGWSNFLAIYKHNEFWLAVKNTAVIVFVSVPISVLVALFIAVALNSVKKFQGFFQTVFFLPYVTNAVAIGMAFAFILATNGLFSEFFNFNSKFFTLVLFSNFFKKPTLSVVLV